VNSLVSFFFQAEDGIRDKLVTGVQTCALPISAAVTSGRVAPLRPSRGPDARSLPRCLGKRDHRPAAPMPLYRLRALVSIAGCSRSEERRVGKECRSRWVVES